MEDIRPGAGDGALLPPGADDEMAGGVESETVGYEALASYILTRGLAGAPPVLQAAHARIRARIEADPAVAARYRELLARLEALGPGHDPRAQFERLVARPPDGRAPAPDGPAPTLAALP